MRGEQYNESTAIRSFGFKIQAVANRSYTNSLTISINFVSTSQKPRQPLGISYVFWPHLAVTTSRMMMTWQFAAIQGESDWKVPLFPSYWARTALVGKETLRRDNMPAQLMHFLFSIAAKVMYSYRIHYQGGFEQDDHGMYSREYL